MAEPANKRGKLDNRSQLDARSQEPGTPSKQLETSSQMLETGSKKLETSEIASQRSDIASQKSEIASQKSEIASQKSEIALQKSEIASQKSEIASQKLGTESEKLDAGSQNLDTESQKLDEGTEQLEIVSQQSGTGSTVANVVRIGPHFKPKRKRIGSDYVKDMLVDLFDIQPYYTFKDLLDITNQPEAYLKSILGEVGYLHRSGPNIHCWELKAKRPPGSVSSDMAKINLDSDVDICKHDGHCTRGKRCRFRHTLPNKPQTRPKN